MWLDPKSHHFRPSQALANPVVKKGVCGDFILCGLSPPVSAGWSLVHRYTLRTTLCKGLITGKEFASEHSVPFFFSAGEFETDNSVLEKKFYAGTPGAHFSCGVGVTEPSIPEPYTPKSFGFFLL